MTDPSEASAETILVFPAGFARRTLRDGVRRCLSIPYAAPPVGPSEPEAGGPWILPGSLRDLARTIRDCDAPDLARQTLRLAKSIEALCMIFDHRCRSSLVPLTDAAISRADAKRIVAARRMIDDRCNETLTLNGIARACGLSRGKLERGFRAMFDTSVADAITERRLAGAQRMLRQTDLPVKAIGDRCGYLDNAAFTRAFSRHVGIAPTRYRAEALAA